ncbi:hypothetical protein [Shewanella salipaludis]|uniref:Uncharacterized protein n=1 Tax=Shewanella salipaludis TaxID=2723052 RepID=A0A972JKN5_9GAMM|nr:hypothetical protein [Shewanella salipaludis]NMH66380.1 hypothetical protein [Shewanella salipaludis]
MISLDSMYAMLARPVRSVFRPKRTVEPVAAATKIATDSHEAPQSQLPPRLERRKTSIDRRRDPDADRRHHTETDRRRSSRQETDANSQTPTDHIDVEV